MKHLRFLVVTVGFTMAASCGWAQNVRVIANFSVKLDSISPSQLRSVFLEEEKSLGGSHVEPVLIRGGAAHEAFLRLYLNRGDSDLQNYYRSLIFTGRGSMPKFLASDAEVVAYVAKTRGAIGYVGSDTGIDGVRDLAVIDSRSVSAAERRLIFRIEPDYPAVLRERSIGGVVRLRVTIEPSGKVTAADLLGGDAALGEAASTAVSKWKYSPGPSRTTAEVSITFVPNP